ncbi:hypothetical protein E2C01_036147 [Portunus trituberculatus]|uniref:Uncharacterized protein n=1 Tax=Portunus trituberculatus TaxID=210409 RepID=A0A5B7FAJ4_PORTR|nr:hypothetical protein [Portunus trituberculatus]
MDRWTGGEVEQRLTSRREDQWDSWSGECEEGGVCEGSAAMLDCCSEANTVTALLAMIQHQCT